MICARNLCKTFRPPGGVRELLRGRLFLDPVPALRDISFEVRPGEILCVMGPNGAGKSTLLRILAGLLAPSSGSAEVAGHDAGRGGSVLRRDVSLVIGDERSFMWPISGRENLLFFAALHGLAPRAARARTDHLLARVGLTEVAGRRFHEYSRGMRQRLAVARGLLGHPRALLLDEPTLGLDPKAAHELRRFLRDEVVRGEGRTALVGSNDPGEVRALADRVLFLERGAVRAECEPERIAAFLGIGDA
jgi:ABC-2 type transport system ATP-binding protein